LYGRSPASGEKKVPNEPNNIIELTPKTFQKKKRCRRRGKVWGWTEGILNDHDEKSEVESQGRQATLKPGNKVPSALSNARKTKKVAIADRGRNGNKTGTTRR